MNHPARILSLTVLLVLALSTGAARYHINLRPVPHDLKCVEEDSAYLYFPRDHERFAPFYQKLDQHLRRGSGRLNILHMGGSHVQAGYLTGQMRRNIVSMRDSASHAASKGADRGLVFPFDAIRTNAPTNYSITYEGVWTASRCISQSPDAILGLSGAAAITSSAEAAMTLSFATDTWAFEQLRVLGYGSHKDVFPVVVMVEGDTIFPAISDKQTGYLFHLPDETTGCRIAFCGLGDGSTFTLRGMLPLSRRQGITYSESGVNGAAVPSWLRCEALKEELSLMPPDLVIFGIGINDAATTYNEFYPEVFKNNYRQLCDRILEVSPQACFLFITNNDCYQSVRVRRHNKNTVRVEQAFKELAYEYDGCVFNLFQVMGGYRSAAKWVRADLMQRDRVHFTREGYELVADLMYNALVRDFTDYMAAPKGQPTTCPEQNQPATGTEEDLHDSQAEEYPI